MKNHKKQRLNEIRKMNCGDYAKIIEYNTSLDISIQFQDEFGHIITNANYANFEKGTLKNP